MSQNPERRSNAEGGTQSRRAENNHSQEGGRNSEGSAPLFETPTTPSLAEPAPLGLRRLLPPPYPISAHGHPAPGPACGTLGRGHSPGRPCGFHGQLEQAGMRAQKAAGSCLREATSSQTALGEGELGGARGEEGRGSLPVSSPPLPPPLPPGRSREPEGRRLAGDSTSLCRRPSGLRIAVAPIRSVGVAVLMNIYFSDY